MLPVEGSSTMGTGKAMKILDGGSGCSLGASRTLNSECNGTYSAHEDIVYIIGRSNICTALEYM